MNCGSNRIIANTGPNTFGTHTARRPFDNARTVAAATCDGVLENGAGDMPSVIRPMTNPGSHQQQTHARSVQRVGQPAAEPLEARLGRTVDVVGPPHPGAGDR